MQRRIFLKLMFLQYRFPEQLSPGQRLLKQTSHSAERMVRGRLRISYLFFFFRFRL